jgi:archaellum component FlaC
MAITIYELERRVTGVEQSFQRIQEQLDRSEKLSENFRAHVNNCFEDICQRLNGHDQNFASIDQRFGRVDQQFERVDRRFEYVGQRFDRIEAQMVTHVDLAAMESRLKDFIRNTFQQPPR